jgi:hypothetical protein
MRTQKPFVTYRSAIAIGSLLIGVSAITAVGCSSESGSDDSLLGGTSKGGTGGTASTTGGGSGAGTGTSGGGTGITVGTSGAGGGGTSGGFEKCAGMVSKASLTPVNMFIQFDRSTSMLQGGDGGIAMMPTPAGTPNKWDQAAAALNAFFKDPKSEGLKIALRFFPDDKPAPGCGGPACDTDACAQPLVPLGSLLADSSPTDVQEGLLLQAIVDSAPMALGGTGMAGMGAGAGGPGTPIFPALQGALKWATANRMITPGEKSVVVLVTDGTPTSCDQDINHIAQLAADALAVSMVQTYAIGIEGASNDQLNTIARAGGTDHAFFAGNGATTQEDLLNALNAIRGTALACQFKVPVSSTGTFDPNKINIQYTNSSGMVTKLAKTADSNACGTGDGWYYDNPAQPTSISLCAGTCTKLQADSAAQLDVEVGCSTMIR